MVRAGSVIVLSELYCSATFYSRCYAAVRLHLLAAGRDLVSDLPRHSLELRSTCYFRSAYSYKARSVYCDRMAAIDGMRAKDAALLQRINWCGLALLRLEIDGVSTPFLPPSTAATPSAPVSSPGTSEAAAATKWGWLTCERGRHTAPPIHTPLILFIRRTEPLI